MTRHIHSTAGDTLALILMAAGLAAAAVAPVILFIEAFEWATRSEWPGLTLADGLGLFGVAHAAPETQSQRLVDLLFALPLSLALFLTGTFLFLAAAGLGSWERERRLRDEMRESGPYAWLLLLAASDVPKPTAVRLLLLDFLLSVLLVLGFAALAAEFALRVAGVEAGWLALAGLSLAAAAALTRAVARRKLRRG